MDDTLLEIKDLEIKYETEEGWITAVSNASFSIDDGQFFGLVGESGCGKSTIAKAILGGLDDNGRITDGEILLNGVDISEYTEKEYNEKLRWSEVSYIPQSSMNSLDPLEKLSDQAEKIAKTHTDLTRREALDRFEELFEIVGIPKNRVHDYPHQFSGGMQQRAIIALSLFLDPSLIIADEPTTALDVVMQDQIFKYLDAVKEENVSMLLITHDISLVFESCQSLAIMHGGQVAETGSVYDLFDTPRHPYSILLQQAFPDLRYPDRDLEVIEGHPPTSMGEVDYCTFADRCPWAIQECREAAPPLESVDSERDDHLAACVRKHEQLVEETTER